MIVRYKALQIFQLRGDHVRTTDAVYTLSDPRELIFKEYVKKLVREKGTFDADFALHENIEVVAPEIIQKKKNLPLPPAPNVDFYNDVVYYMLGVPPSFYTAIRSSAKFLSTRKRIDLPRGVT